MKPSAPFHANARQVVQKHLFLQRHDSHVAPAQAHLHPVFRGQAFVQRIGFFTSFSAPDAVHRQGAFFFVSFEIQGDAGPCLRHHVHQIARSRNPGPWITGLSGSSAVDVQLQLHGLPGAFLYGSEKRHSGDLRISKPPLPRPASVRQYIGKFQMAALHMYFSGADGKLFSVPLRQVSHPEQVQAADFTGPVLSAVSSFLLPACLIELPVHPGGITQAGHGPCGPGLRQSDAQLSSAHGRLRIYRQPVSARQTPDELPVRLPVLDDRETYWLSVQLFRAEYGHSGLRSRLPDDLPAGHGHILKEPLFYFKFRI